jgi:hypothetical protein
MLAALVNAVLNGTLGFVSLAFKTARAADP